MGFRGFSVGVGWMIVVWRVFLCEWWCVMCCYGLMKFGCIIC